MVELNANEARVLGVLVEKALTTPDQYPLTVNAVVNGANQKNNRHPLTNIDDGDALSALIGLRTKGLVVQQDAPGQRAPRWRHKADEGLKVNKPELVVLAELMLRGPQTLGELRGRASRMYPLESLDMVRNVIEQLRNKPDGAMVKEVPPAHGSRAERYVQLLCPALHSIDEVEEASAEIAEVSAPVGGARGAGAGDRLAKLEAEVAMLRGALARLAAEVGSELANELAAEAASPLKADEGPRVLRIALVILHADPAKGGAERYTVDLAAALAARGHEVALVASTFGPRPAGVEWVELGEHGLTRLGRYRRFLDDVDAHLTGRAYDVVHAMLPVRRCDVYHPHAGVAADAIARGHLKHAGAITRALARVGNRLNVKRNAFARVERQLLTAARPPVVLCLSEYVKETVRRHYPGLGEERLATLFNAVDLARFDPAAADGGEVRRRFDLAGRVVGLMIAQDFERKGLREAIEALAATKSSGAPGRAPQAERLKGTALLVVGKGDVSAYHARAEGLGVADDVIFAGPTADPRAFYAAADFFVLPTRHDPCSLVVLEALAMGVPVISTKQNGACEIMTAGEHGFVLDSADDAAGLAAATGAMVDGAIRARMRAACLQLRPRLAYGAHLDALMAAYARIDRGTRDGGRF